MSRVLSPKNLKSKKNKHFCFEGVWEDCFGNPDVNGAWLIYGKEKNGKTTFSLKLAEYLSTFGKTLYVSAEEGFDGCFVEAVKRADIKSRRLGFSEYITISELHERLDKHKSEKIVFIDNLTVYSEDLKGDELRRLIRDHNNKLFVFISHEERSEPYPATAKQCSRLAKYRIRIQGLKAIVSSRSGNKGEIDINDNASVLFHGKHTQ